MEVIVDDLYSWVDIVQLGQVLFNLFKNVYEVCSEVELFNDDVELWLICLLQWVWLEVLDCGKGMNEVVLQNVLMLFYLIKCNGIGLGLVFMCEIVEVYGGCILLQNCCEGGLCVVVFLLV